MTDDPEKFRKHDSNDLGALGDNVELGLHLHARPEEGAAKIAEGPGKDGHSKIVGNDCPGGLSLTRS
jgi:hypothetical protein